MDEVSVGPINDAATCAPSTVPRAVTTRGLTLETPPAQPDGGGFNSTLAAGTITLASSLASGASSNVNFAPGIQQTGGFRFLIVVEALP